MKINKCLKALAVAVLMFVSGICMVACNEDDSKVVDMTITGLNTTLELDVAPGAQPDYSGVKVTLKYENDKTEDAKASDLEYSSLDLAQLGTQLLTIKHKPSEFTKQVSITIIESYENAFLMSLESELLTSLNSLSSTKFVNKTANLKAGDDNLFDLQLKGTAIADITADEPEEVVINNCYVDIDVKYKDGNDFVDGSSLVEIHGNKIDFKDEAVGKTFKISVSPRYIAEGYEDNISLLEYVIDVVDGYNVYTAKDLSVINNVDEMGWHAFKLANGYATNDGGYQEIDAKSVVLQKDINITDQDIPADFFWNKNDAASVGTHEDLRTYKTDEGTGPTVEGSMRDYAEVYHRELSATGESFAIHGNYFQVKYNNLSRVVVENRNINEGFVIDDGDKQQLLTTHATLFKFHGPENNTQTDLSDLVVENLDIQGNGARTAKGTESGGIIAFKISGVDSNCNNNTYVDTFVGFMYEDADVDVDTAKHVLKDTVGENSFSSLLYVYGAKDLTIEGGSYVGAGGPVMIVDHVGGNEYGENGYPSYVKVINSRMESFVTGNEPWFVTYGATALVGQIAASNKYYTDNGSTYLVDKDGVQNLFNLKVVYKSSGVEGLTSYVVRGGVAFFENRADYETAVTNETVFNMGLDMDTYSSQAIANKDNITTNSRYTGEMGATPYFIAGGYIFQMGNMDNVTNAQTVSQILTAAQNNPELMSAILAANNNNSTLVAYALQASLLKLSSMVEGTGDNTDVKRYAKMNLTINDNVVYSGQDMVGQIIDANTIKVADKNYTIVDFSTGVTIKIPAIPGQHESAKNYTFSGKFIYDGENAIGIIDGNNIVMKDGSFDGEYKIQVVDSNADNKEYNLVDASNTSIIISNITSVSGINTFTISTQDGNFAQVAPTGTTNVNYYIFNGMGIVIELYEVEE